MSIQNFLSVAIKKAEIKKRVTLHSLLHSFAKVFLEQESPMSTMIYTHFTTKGFGQIKSPFNLWICNLFQ
jgi:integrase/recombinase XerD